MLGMSCFQSYAEQYFASSNFLNKKILEDIANVKDSYEDAWNGLEEKEKEQVFRFFILYLYRILFNFRL